MKIELAWVAIFVTGTAFGVLLTSLALRPRRAPKRRVAPRRSRPLVEKVAAAPVHASPPDRRASDSGFEVEGEVLPGVSMTRRLTTAGVVLLLVAGAIYRLPGLLPDSPRDHFVPERPQTQVIINITESTRSRLDSVVVVDEGDYVIRRAPRQDLVEGLSGSWYEIDLRQADRRHALLFPRGEYEQAEYESRFREVMERVQADVLKPGLNYTLFVRGSADILDNEDPVIGTVMNGSPVTVEYLRKKPGDPNVYLNDRERDTISVNYSNEDLPNLRGDYVRRRLLDQNPRIPVVLLDGGVTSQVSEADRNAQIFLFLPHTLPQSR